MIFGYNTGYMITVLAVSIHLLADFWLVRGSVPERQIPITTDDMATARTGKDAAKAAYEAAREA